MYSSAIVRFHLQLFPRVQSVIDDLRDQMAQKVMEAEAEEDEPEED